MNPGTVLLKQDKDISKNTYNDTGLSGTAVMSATAVTSTKLANVAATRTSAVDPISNSTNKGEKRRNGWYHHKPLPLPDPLPSKLVQRYTKLSYAELKASIDEEDKKIKVCFERLGSLSGFYRERQKIFDSCRPEIETVRCILNESEKEFRDLVTLQGTLRKELRALQNADNAARRAPLPIPNGIVGVGKECKEALRNVGSISALESRRKDLERVLETGSLSIADEKKLVKQIAFLQHRGRAFVLSLEKAAGQKVTDTHRRGETRKKLERAHAVQDLVTKADLERLQYQRGQLRHLQVEQRRQVETLDHSAVCINRKVEKGRLKELKERVGRLRKDFGDRMDEWYLNERIYFEQKRIASGAAHWPLQPCLPVMRIGQTHHRMCNALIHYLESLDSKVVDKPRQHAAPVHPRVSETGTSGIFKASGGGRVIGKCTCGSLGGFEDVGISAFARKDGIVDKSSRHLYGVETPSSSHSAGSLKEHPVEHMRAFWELGVRPPKRFSDVPDTITLVKEKQGAF